MVLRLLESVVGRALAVVPVAVTGIFKPSGQTNITDAAAIGMFTVDGTTGLPNSVTSPTFISTANAAGSFPVLPYGSYSSSEVVCSFYVLSTIAAQPFTMFTWS